MLFLYLSLRLHNLLTFPPFLDEVDHITWASDLYTLHPFTGAANGKLFGLWWMALFDLHGDGVLFVVRAATSLFCMIGVAAVYSLGYSLASLQTGLLSAAIYTFAPFPFFFERLGLVDPYVATWGILSLWFAVRYGRRARDLDALLSGLSLTGAITAKASGVMLFVIPGLVFFVLPSALTLRQRLRGSLLSFGVLLIIWVPFYLFLSWRGYRYFNTATAVVGTSQVSGLPERLLGNFVSTWQIDSLYFSQAFLLAACMMGLYLMLRRWRVGLFLLLTLLLPLAGLLAFATKLSSRYVLFHLPMLILLFSIGLDQLALDLARRFRPLRRNRVIVAACLLWLGLFALPFLAQYWSEAKSLALPRLDRIEYISSDSSGYSLDAIAGYLQGHAQQSGKPVHVVGLLVNCGGLDLYIPQLDPVTVECPYITIDGSKQTEIAVRVNQLVEEVEAGAGYELWIVLEERSYATLEGIKSSYEPVARFERPDGLTELTVYTLSGRQ